MPHQYHPPRLDHSVNVRSEVLTAVTMKNSVLWDMTSCGSCKSQHFGVFLRSVLHLIATPNGVPSSQILSTLMIVATRSSVTSAFTRVTRHHIPEDDILHPPPMFLPLCKKPSFAPIQSHSQSCLLVYYNLLVLKRTRRQRALDRMVASLAGISFLYVYV
jgi:hypothetical protein